MKHKLIAKAQEGANSKAWTSKTGRTNFMNSKGGMGYSTAMSGIGNVADGVKDLAGLDKTMNSNDALAEGIRDTASDTLISSGNPIAMAIGAGIKAIGATGGFTDGTKGISKGADIGNTIAASLIPGAGWFVKKLPEYHESQELQNSSSYTGTKLKGDETMGFAGAKALFGRNKAKQLIQEQKERDYKVANVVDTGASNIQIAQNMSDANSVENNYLSNGGWNRKVSIGKLGLKLEEPTEDLDYDQIYNSAIQSLQELISDRVSYFKKGGQMNVIPEGALHARLHHMENGDNITKKGIPVIDVSGEQQAEIECNEIIFNKDATTKFENLYKQYIDTSDKNKKDALAIEAGKFIANEILNNTEDRTGLLKTI